MPSLRQSSLAVTDVTNYLAFARREFRRCVLNQLREMTVVKRSFAVRRSRCWEWIRNEIPF